LDATVGEGIVSDIIMGTEGERSANRLCGADERPCFSFYRLPVSTVWPITQCKYVR
jgi:hypothetical protein